MKMCGCKFKCLCKTCAKIKRNCSECKISVDKTKECLNKDGIKEIDNKQWEIFWMHKETKDAYYGTPV